MAVEVSPLISHGYRMDIACFGFIDFGILSSQLTFLQHVEKYHYGQVSMHKMRRAVEHHL